MRSLLSLLPALLLTFVVTYANSQQITKGDTTQTQFIKDTTTYGIKGVPLRYRGAHPRIPVLAFGLSLLYPIGLGQVYNKEYGKAGIILGTEVVSIIVIASTLRINFN